MNAMEYTDSRGVEMTPLSFSEALEIVYSLASDNMIDENDYDGDEALEEQLRWQDDALEALQNLIENHASTLDGLGETTKAQEWPDEVWRADRKSDPSDPISAIRICLDSAEQAALDPRDCERDIALADQADLQQQAFDVVRDLLGMHGDELEGIQATWATPSR